MKRALLVVSALLLLGAVRGHFRGPLPAPVRKPVVPPPSTAEGRGALVYARYGCAMCHGEDGRGGFPNPNAETEGKVPAVVYVAEGYTDAELRRLLLDGRPVVGRADASKPRPPYRMPGWRGAMAKQELDDLVRFLMSLYPEGEKQAWD